MTDTLRIVADENMPGLAQFAALGDLRALPGRQICRQDLCQADILLVRSVTRVDAALLAATPVRFVGSATIGTDHVDLPALAQRGIAFAHAAGCNAAAVAEYVLQAALCWAVDNQRSLSDMTVAVIGLGQVGSRVARLFAALGATICAVDPPRAAAGDDCRWGWQSLADALQADLLTLHVPLTDAGAYATRHLLDRVALSRLTPKQLLINTSRGAVIDNQALLAAPLARLPALVLDVWEQEPQVPLALFQRVRLGTPHVAGYSVQGKWRGSMLVYQALLRFLDLTAPLPQAPQHAETLSLPIMDQAGLLALLSHRYSQRADHQALARVLSAGSADGFDCLRRDYPVRHELAGVRVTGAVAPGLLELLTLLGVVCE